ncbi:hypothetical protein EDB19DRAFT_1824780 [Suillus lakei]|nr:hypothetical protein EDB19DRAFT_1824780 [Suillus lakei]
MPRSNSGSGHGCGCGCSTSGAQVAPADTKHTGSIPPFQPIPFQHESNSTLEHLASAATMIETDGDPTNTLLEHQSHQWSSQLPSQEHLRPYSIPSSRTTSRRTSRASRSIYDVDGDKCPLAERARRSSKMELKPTDMKYYSKVDQKNIKHACKLIILDMLLESRWQRTSDLDVTAQECLLQASDTSDHITECMDGTKKLIFDALLTIRGKLINEAEQVLLSLDIYPSDNSTMSDDKKSNYIKQRMMLLLDDLNLTELLVWTQLTIPQFAVESINLTHFMVYILTDGHCGYMCHLLVWETTPQWADIMLGLCYACCFTCKTRMFDPKGQGNGFRKGRTMSGNKGKSGKTNGKGFGCEAGAKRVRSGCEAGAKRVRSGCEAGAKRVRSGCEAGAKRVRSGCEAGAKRVRSGCEAGAKRVRSGCEAGAKRVRSGCEAGAKRVRSGCEAGAKRVRSGCEGCEAGAQRVRSGCEAGAKRGAKTVCEAGAKRAVRSGCEAGAKRVRSGCEAGAKRGAKRVRSGLIMTNVFASSSSLSSGTSWYPCKNEHDPVAAKSPQMAPCQYYPHYSPSESPYQPHWNTNSSGDAVQPDDSQEQQLVTHNPPMLSPYGSNVSDQYSFGNSSWSGAPGGWGGPMA